MLCTSYACDLKIVQQIIKIQEKLTILLTPCHLITIHFQWYTDDLYTLNTADNNSQYGTLIINNITTHLNNHTLTIIQQSHCYEQFAKLTAILLAELQHLGI